jgi:hypothetical protein
MAFSRNNQSSALFVLLTSILCGIHCMAQPSFDYSEISEKYSKHHALFLKNEEVFQCKVSKGKLDIMADNLSQVLFLDNMLTTYSEQSVVYSPGFYTISHLDASTYVPQGDKYKKVPVSGYKDIDYTGGVSFYDGTRARKFYFEGIDKNVITETKFRYHFEDPTSLGAFFFRRGVPCLQSVYTFIVENDIELGYKLFGDTAGIEFSKTTQGKLTTYKWEMKDVKEVKHFDDEVNSRYNEPHIFVYVKSYMSKNKKVTLYNSVADLYKNDYPNIKNLNKSEPLPGLESVVDSIVKVSSSPTAITRGVYYWVQQNMKYVAFENGQGGQVPREANDVFTKKYGDCKDFASIITQMLTIAKIPSYMVWIGTRDIPYTYEELPLGYSSNHMIAATFQDNKWVFIDGTSKHIPYGVPSAFIQGKEGLISISEDSFLVVRIPVMPPAFNHSMVKVNMDLDLKSHILSGTGSYNLEGYNHDSWASSLYYSGVDKIETHLKDYIKMGNNKFSTTNLTYTNLFVNDSPLIVNFDYTLPNYAKVIDNDIYVNMNLVRTFNNFKVDTAGNRTIAKNFSYTWIDEFKACLNVPEGYQVKKVPNNLSYNGPHLSYSFTYTNEKNCVCIAKKSTYDKLEVSFAEFDEWNTQIDKIYKYYNELIILTPKP